MKENHNPVQWYASVAQQYVTRPHYPDGLFKWLAAQASSRQTAWDCACGSGQATHDLARYFSHVAATDASSEQVRLASLNPKITFRVATAEDSGIANRSVDLINVGMAAHWFNLPRFYNEVIRVAKQGAILSLLVYGEPEISGDDRMNDIVRDFSELIEPYGSKEIRIVRSKYRDLYFPFNDELALPEFKMEADMTLPQFAVYLRSRSSVRDYEKTVGRDSVAAVESKLERHVSPDSLLQIKWPLYGRVARLGAQ